MVQLIVGTNSYGLLSEADAYLDGSFRTAGPWLSVGEEDKARCLVSGFRQLERQRWQGTATGVRLVASVVIADGGTGYAAKDVLTVSGGTFGEAAIVLVRSVSAGAVATVELLHAGTYTVDEEPTSPVATTGGSGSGCTLTITFADQASDFPRTGLVDCDGRALDSNTYPSILKAAQFELAFAMSQDPDAEIAGGTESNLRSVGAGSARVEFFRPDPGSGRFPPQVQELISCLLAGSLLSGGVHSGAGVESSFEDYPSSYGLTRGY